MAERHWFGQSPTDWAFTVGEGNVPVLSPGTPVTMWSQPSGGVQYLDLLDLGGNAITEVETGDGSVFPVGQYPRFQGPVGVTAMWADAGGGTRYLLVATDLGDIIPTVEAADAAITSHIDGDNPHQTRLDDIVDVNAATPGDGQTLAWDATTGQWIPDTIEGVTNAVTTDTPQTITAPKIIELPAGDITSQALAIRLPAGDRATAPDTFAIFVNEGTDADPIWQRTGYLNEYGEFRVIPSATTRVPLRIRLLAGQINDGFQVTDIDNNPLMWVTADGRVRAPNIDVVPPFAVQGAIATGVGTLRWYNDTGRAITLRSVRASVGTPPAGAGLVVDVNLNGASVFGGGGQPTIPAGANTSGAVTAITTTTIPAGGYLTVDIDQVGSSTPGDDLTVQILAY